MRSSTPIATTARVMAAALVASPAMAEPPGAGGAAAREHVELSWVRGPGAESCATESDIAARVTSRLGRHPFVSRADRTIEVVVHGTPDQKKVELFLRGPAGELLGERSLESTDPDCAAIEEASVLAIALLIDPEALLAPPPGASEVTPAAPLPPPTAGAVPPVWVPLFIPVPTAPPAPPVVPPHAPTRITAALGVEGLVGPLPRPALGLALGVDIEPVRRVHGTAAMRWTPEVESDDADFSFSLVRGELGLCIDAVAGSRWALAGCGAFSVGALTATSLRLSPVDPGEEVWVDLGAGIRGTLEPAPPFILALEVGGRAALIRPQFQIAGADAAAFEPAVAAGSATFSSGVRFP